VLDLRNLHFSRKIATKFIHRVIDKLPLTSFTGVFTMKYFLLLLLPFLGFLPANASSIVYQGEAGPGAGKHIVFLASDHEYRAEETCPALARILAKHHGFKCTVVFGLDEKGFIEAGSSNISGLEALRDADLFVIFARFLNPPAEQMDEIVAYLERGGPVVGLRTSSHAFKIPNDSPYAKYDFKSKVEGYENGFGHQILGNTWVGHYGTNHKQGTRIKLVSEQKDHVILTGVGDNAFCHAGGYVGKPGPDFTVLTHSQPLVSMDPEAAPDPNKPPMPSTWTRHYQAKDGGKHRVFHSTQGASQDILDENYRRLLINGIFWAAGIESAIQSDLDIGFVGPFQPSRFSNAGHVKGVRPADLAGWDSPIMPQPTK
jgi:type 1 glutamine amidotransferase